MPDSLTIQLVNQTTSSNVYAYITGLALQRDCARVLLKADGKGLYYPASPAGGKILQPLAEDCAIALGVPGNTVTVTIPQIAGGRIWFSAGERKLTFLLNPGGPGGGAALVEPSVLNPSDPNAGVDFCFCEFTLNSDQLFANISYVDFVARLPIALTLRTRTGAVQHVSGMPADGLARVCDGLCAQAARDGRPWDKLIVSRDGQPLRVLSPTHGEAVGASFAGYFEPLVEAAWQRYREQQQAQAQGQGQAPGEPPKHGLNLLARLKAKAQGQGSDQQQAQQPSAGCALLRIDTQAAAGIVTGSVAAQSDELVLAGESFQRPTTADILGCNSGPFTTGPSATRNAIIPRLAAAFQRSAIAADGVDEHPSHPDTFYRCEPTNHYSRVVHEANLDGKGYAFAYDDVQPDGGADQSGKVNAGDPEVFVVAVGGGGAYVGDRMP
ncbi:glycoside hydrolase family 64 protein [Lasiosphaeria ovina]|uniref:Glycoside hydrolase family 64 protein n=1 Tax=Lasiosphaeria ovina TaxID=92902 RepID=A0AAE0JYC0_9PEZI|nr:glycoside hydrolase family 64 protein [Lasiosphaeria ovina]